MAKAAWAGLSLPPGTVFKPSGRQLVTMYLAPTAFSGKLSDAILPGGCSVAAGVDVFAVSPNALPFKPTHKRQHGEVWGYFAGAHMAESIQPAPGGCWVLCGKEKIYVLRGQTIAYRSSFAFHVTRVEADGRVMWAPTRWMMKEYRLNKDAAMFREKKLACPGANLDFVIRKVFTKPAVPPLQPARSGEALLQRVVVRAPTSQAQPTKVPVKAGVLAVRPDSTKTKTMKAVHQGGSSLPPRSARPPRSRPPRAQLLAPPPAQGIGTSVAPSHPTQVIAKPVAPPPPPKVIETPVAPPHQTQVIAKPVAPPPPPKVIATPVAPPPPPARSSGHKATSSREQADNPNANMELVACRVPAKPPMFKAPSDLQIKIIAAYLVPKAVHGQLPGWVTPGFVAEGVDVFAVSPDALPFPPSHRKPNGEVWGYFFAATPTTSMRLARGGCWMQYGREKKYCGKDGDVVAFRCRFAFHAARVGGDGVVAWEQTRWLMKEYRINTAAPSVRELKKAAGANMNVVVLKVFTKPMMVPSPPPPDNAGSNSEPQSQGLHDALTELKL